MEISDGMHMQYAGTVIKFSGRGWVASPFCDRIILEKEEEEETLIFTDIETLMIVIFTTFMQIQNLKCLYGQYSFNTNMTY